MAYLLWRKRATVVRDKLIHAQNISIELFNAIEENNAHAASGTAWRYRVQLDDGRMATVTQYDNPGYHPGNRVVIRGDHIEALRE